MAQNNIVNLVVPQRSERTEMYQLELDLPSRLSAIDWSTEYPVLCEGDGEVDDDDLHTVSSCLLEEIIDENAPASDKTTENDLNCGGGDLCDSVTHIEIIKAKTIAPRRVSGANRVVPLITSVWQNNTCKIREPTLANTYRNILYDPDTNDDKECKICFQKLFSSFELEHHVMLVHGIRPSPEQCFVCRRKFIFRTALKNHLSKYHGIQYPDMICKICFMEFNSSFENKAHERKHEKLIACQFCSLKFASEYFYQSHFDSHLVCLKPFVCNKCGTRCRNSSVLSVHEKRHLQLSCLLCHLLFDNELKLIMHVATHEPEEQEVFLATLEELDEEEKNLDRMLKIYTKTVDSLASTPVPSLTDTFNSDAIECDVRNCVEGLLTSVTEPDDVDVPVDKKVTHSNCFVCKLCGLEVAFGKVMMEHHRKHHLRNRTCLFCGKRNVSVTQTMKHLATHFNSKISADAVSTSLSKSDEAVSRIAIVSKRKVPKSNQIKKNLNLSKPTSNKLYSCSTCSQKFRSKMAKDKHLLIHKLETKASNTLHCTICNQIFHRPKFLQKHMLQHNNNYQCETCGKVCMSHTKLRAHLRSHAPVDVRQKFKCSFCSVSCSTFSGLRVHLRIHTGERPYSCDQCKKRFKRLQAMKKHEMLVHRSPDAVLHQCRECPMKFNVRGNLLRHFLLIHRGFRRFICGMCGHRYGQNQDLQRHLKMKHQIDAPSITGKAKKSASDIYVIPSLENLPPSDPHATNIQQIVDEERLKFKNLGDLDIMEESEVNRVQPQTLSPQEACVSDAAEKDQHLTVDPPSSQEPTLCVDEQLSQQPVQEETVCTDIQPQFIPLLGLLAQIGKTQCSLTNSDPSTFKLQTCDLCNKLFFLESAFKEHVERRGGHSCSECSMRFCEAEKLQEHVTKEHPTNIIYQCGICMVHFSRTSSLMQQHMQEAHVLLTSNSVITPTATVSNVNCFMGENICYDLKNQVPVAVNPTAHTLSKIPFAVNDVFLPNVVYQSTGTVPTFPINSIPTTYTSNSILPTQTIPPVFILQPPVLQTSSVVSLPSQSVTCTPDLSIIESASAVAPEPECVSLPSSEATAATDCSSSDVSSSHPAVENVKCESKRARKGVAKNSDDGNFDCKQCGKHFSDQLRLNRHMNTHSGNAKPFICSQCNKGFAEKHNLNVHMRTHTGERPYACEECGKTMRYQKEYADHKRKHEGLKPHECKVCGRKFLRQRELTRHSLLHSDEKRFQCDICDKKFNRRDQFQMHVRSHTKLTIDELFVCSHCSKAYRTKSKLQAHLVLHTGEKNYQCSLCNKCFALEDYLRSHLKTHKKRDGYVTCNKCPRKFASQRNLEIHLKTFHVKQKRVLKSPAKNTDVGTGVLTIGKSGDPVVNIEDGFEIMEMSMLSGVGMLEADKSNTIYFHTVQEDLDQELDISTS